MLYRSTLVLTTFAMVLALGADASRAASFHVWSDLADGIARDSGPSYDGIGDYGGTSENNSTEANIGRLGGAEDQAFVFSFQLPTIPSGEIISGSSIYVWLHNYNNGSGGLGSAPSFHLDLWGLTRYDASPNVQISDFQGAGTMIAPSFLSGSNSLGGYVSFTGAALDSFLNAQYTAGAVAGDFVFIRLLRNDGGEFVSPGVANRHYAIRTANFSGTDSDPYLVINTVVDNNEIPEPSSFFLGGFGLCALVAFARRRRASRGRGAQR